MVRVPPSIAEKPIGIIRDEAGILVLRETCMMPGKKSAAAPMFCIKPDKIPTEEEIRTISFFLLVPAFLIANPEKFSIIPVLAMPRPSIITDIIAITALLENPENISCGVRIPVQPKASIQQIATTSMRTSSKISIRTVAERIVRTIIILVSIKGMPDYDRDQLRAPRNEGNSNTKGNKNFQSKHSGSIHKNHHSGGRSISSVERSCLTSPS
jgi:hypothetical protein